MSILYVIALESVRKLFCCWRSYTSLSGQFYYMDTRKNEPIISKKVHNGGARSVAQSYYTKDLLSTCGEDGVNFFGSCQ